MRFLALLLALPACDALPSCPDACRVLYDDDANSCGSTDAFSERPAYTLDGCKEVCRQSVKEGSRDSDEARKTWTSCVYDLRPDIIDGAAKYGSANVDACGSAIIDCGYYPCSTPVILRGETEARMCGGWIAGGEGSTEYQQYLDDHPQYAR